VELSEIHRVRLDGNAGLECLLQQRAQILDQPAVDITQWEEENRFHVSRFNPYFSIL